MTKSKSTYRIAPHTGGEEPYDLEADRYEFDKTSGRHSFYQGDELVASLVNVNVRKTS